MAYMALGCMSLPLVHFSKFFLKRQTTPSFLILLDTALNESVFGDCFCFVSGYKYDWCKSILMLDYASCGKPPSIIGYVWDYFRADHKD